MSAVSIKPVRDSAGDAPVAYTGVAVALHWSIAGLIVCCFALGWVMTEMVFSPLKVSMFSWHKWAGVTVLALAAIRALWRLTHPVPAPVAMPDWQRVAAQAVHGLLYALMFALPLSGWVYGNAAGYPVVYLGLVRLPSLVVKNKALAEAWLQIHSVLGWVLFVSVVLHALGALKHHFIDGDATLKRMLSGQHRAG